MSRKPTDLPDSFDPAEMALDATRGDASPGNPARILLTKHAILAEHDIRHRRLQIASERAGLAVKGLTVFAGLVVAALAGALLWDAAHADGLVIDAFTVPPDLQARGLTGQEMASEVVDRLNVLQAQTQSTRAPESFSNAWARDISVQIPETGVSIGEVQRLLRGWLGHEKHVTGSVTHTAKGLRIIIRLPGQPADVVEATAGDTDTLASKAGEALYGRTQPYRYGTWLWENGRVDEGLKVHKALAKTGDRRERAWALEGLANNLSDFPSQVAGHKAALALDPTLALAWNNLGGSEGNMGHAEAALFDARKALVLLQRPDHGQVRADVTPLLIQQGLAGIAASIGDYRANGQALDRIEALPDFFGSHAQAPSQRVLLAALLHDAAGAQRLLAMVGADDGAISAPLLVYGGMTTPNAVAAFWREDWTEVVRQFGSVEARAKAPGVAAPGVALNGMLAVNAWPLQAEALARLGRIDEAEALIAKTPLDCEVCLRARGRIASLKHDWAGADHWFGEAVRQNPSIPFAYADWGQSVMDRGQPAQAIYWFRQANLKSPNFADPIEQWGEAVLATGDAKGAEAKFRAAGAITPMWGRLHLQWGEALMRLGRPVEARAQWLTARGLDLSAGDRASLEALMAGAH